MKSHIFTLLFFLACACFVLADPNPTLEVVIGDLYQRHAVEQAPVPSEQVLHVNANAVALITQADAASRPDLIAQAYQALCSINRGTPGTPTIVVDRALIDIGPRADTYDEARETAIYALARCRSEDIERVVAALADTASTDARGRVVDAALGALGVMGGSTDPRIYQRLVLDPTLENAELFSTERGTEADARREVGIRAEAMLCRLRAGTLGTDVNVYATLNDLGRKAAAFGLLKHLCELPAPDPALNDAIIVNKCVELFVSQFGTSDIQLNEEQIDFVRGVGMGMGCTIFLVANGHCDVTALDAIDNHLDPLRVAIAAQSNGEADPRLEIIAHVVQTVASTREGLDTPSESP